MSGRMGRGEPGAGGRGVKITMEFGALAPPLAEQLSRHELEIPAPELAQLQADADAIARLHVRSLLSDAEARKAHKRLMSRISASAGFA